jgi:uncharacterized Zn finger protein
MTWGDIQYRVPQTCPRCSGSDFEHLATGRMHGSRGPGVSWRVRCRACGAVSMAMILLDALHEGKALDWFNPDEPDDASPPSGGA